jgi:hypothetical protein
MGEEAQEGREEMVFALCHELSQSIRGRNPNVESCDERAEHASTEFWYYYWLD